MFIGYIGFDIPVPTSAERFKVWHYLGADLAMKVKVIPFDAGF